MAVLFVGLLNCFLVTLLFFNPSFFHQSFRLDREEKISRLVDVVVCCQSAFVDVLMDGAVN